MRTAIIAIAALCLGVGMGRFFTSPTIQLHPCPGSTFIGDGILINQAQVQGSLTIIGNQSLVMNCLFQYKQPPVLILENATKAQLVGNYFDLTAIH